MACVTMVSMACTPTRRQVKRDTIIQPPPVQHQGRRATTHEKVAVAPHKLSDPSRSTMGPSPSNAGTENRENSQENGQTRPVKPARSALVKQENQHRANTVTGSPFSHVVLLNGGQNARINFYSHLQHLKVMHKTLQQRGVPDKDITIFSSDGENNNPDLVAQNPPSPLEKILFDFLRKEAFLVWPRRRSINTTIPGKQLRPSKRWALNQFFRDLPGQLSEATHKDRPVLVFVTDHGLPNRSNYRNNKISLWHETMNVGQYHQMLRPLGKRRVISVMSQCFSGGFAWSIYRRPGRLSVPTGNRCGFYSTIATRPAYGCYPDTSKQKFVGHAHRFAQALARAKNLEEAHRLVNLTDQTPDVPMRSSDSYLQALLREEASRQGLSFRDFVNQTLARYRSQGYPGYRQDNELLQAISRRFGYPTPTSLRQTKNWSERLKEDIKGWNSLERNWLNAFARIRNANLRRWYAQDALFEKRVKEKYREYRNNPDNRRYMDQDNDIQKLRQGFVTFVKRQPSTLQRIKRLHHKLQATHAHVFWGMVQRAVFLRMERQLIRIAGRLILQHETSSDLQPHREGLKNLLACEATPLGQTNIGQPIHLAKLKPINPPPAPYHSWLGVKYQPVRSHADKRLTPGSVQVTGVYPNTPASQGGVQAGDFILATNGKNLQNTYDLAERVMLHSTEDPFILRILRNNQLLNQTVKLRRTYGTHKYSLAPLKNYKFSSWNPLKVLSNGASLPQIKQSTALVFFWATWCGPCKAALPALRRFKQKYRSQGLRVITVSSEAPKQLKGWLSRFPQAMPFTNTQDPHGMFSIKMRITATPTFVLLHHGKVKLAHRGFHKVHVIEQAIQQWLSRSGS